MKRPTIVLLVFLLSCTSGTENSSSTDTSADTPDGQAVEAKLRQYYQDMSDRNWEKYRSHFWPGATITTAWKQPGDSVVTVDVTTIDDFIKETPQGPDSQPIFEESMLDSEIRSSGNIAEAWVNYKAKFGTKENLAEWSGTDVFTFLRHEGEWKIVSLVFESGE